MIVRQLTLYDDAKSWARLLAVCFDREHHQMVQLLHWLNDIGELIAYGVWDDKQLVAQYSCMKRDLFQHTKKIPICMSMNMAVHPNYRGRGLIKTVSRPVYDTFASNGCVAGVGFSNAEGVKVDKHSRGYGYQVVGQLESIVVPTHRYDVNDIEISHTWSANSTSNVFWQPKGIHFAKDKTHLQKRYLSHPFRKYQLDIIHYNDSIQGIFVYRETRLWGFKVVALIDIYANNVNLLFRQWSTVLKRRRFRFIHLLTSPNSQINQTLRREHTYIRIPITRTPYYLTVKPIDNEKSQLLEFDHWNLIGGDIL